MDELTRGLVAVVVFGVACQWLAARLHLPSILLLLVAGILAGPVTGFVDPDDLLGDLVFPAVSLGVAVLLFEGGLGLRFRRLAEGRATVLRLVTVGVAVTWGVAAVAIWLLFDVTVELAVVAGSILVVSGPTVVLPVLRVARLREPTTSILRWEGIFIDPIGAVLAAAVFSAVYESGSGVAGSALNVATTAVSGTLVGLLAAAGIVFALQRHLVDDDLQNPVTLMVVLAAFAVANAIRPEAGLFAATVAGVALANQRRVPLRHIAEFEESLGTLIAAVLFVILGARLDLGDLGAVALPALLLCVILVLVGRPVAVWASTIGSTLGGRDRAYLACMAPRGIVAAAVSSLFAIELEERGVAAEPLVPLTFAVIFVTVTVYGLGAKRAAGWLRVASPPPRGMALVGTAPWILDLAEHLLDEDVPVLVVSPDADDAEGVLARGVLLYDGPLEGEDFTEAIETVGIGQAVILSGRPALDALAVRAFTEAVGQANTFVLSRDGAPAGGTSSRSRGRQAFPEGVTASTIEERVSRGAHFTTVGAGTVESLSDTTPLFVHVPDRPPRVVTPENGTLPAESRVTVLSSRF